MLDCRIGGGPVQLIAFVLGYDMTAAWEWAGRFAGIEPEAGTWTAAEKRQWALRQQHERERRRAADAADAEREDAAARAIARAIWRASGPLAGTLGEIY